MTPNTNTNHDALTEYQAAERKLETAQDILIETMGDKHAARAAMAIVDFYRKRRNEAFEAWRATWGADAT